MRFLLVFACFFFCLVSVLEADEYYPEDIKWVSTQRDDVENPDEYYDFVGTLIYCKPDNAQFGYRDANSDQPCSSPGPTIRVISGFNYLLYLKLGDADLSELAAPKTNIHTHGLMISGSENADDISRTMSAEDGCIAYNWTVLQDHAGGLCWYHAHAHGSTDEQVSQGGYGALIIEDRDAEGNWPQFPSADAFGLEALCDKKHERILFMAAVESEWHLNGKISETTLLPVDDSTWYRLRLLVSQPAGTRVDPWYVTNAIRPSNRCEFRNLAYDGHWRSSVPSSPVSHWNISAAGRMDVAFRCPKGGRRVVHEIVLGLENPRIAAKIIVKPSSGKADISSPYYEGEVWNPNLPPWQQSMMDAQVEPENQHSVALSPTSVTYDDNRYSYDPDQSTDVWNYGDILQFTVSRSSIHPFHLHIYPMQIQEGCSPHEVGEFYDTISSLDSHCVVKFRVYGEPGKAVMHCHLLRHEDNGAMTWANVVGGPDLALEPFPSPDSCKPDSAPVGIF